MEDSVLNKIIYCIRRVIEVEDLKLVKDNNNYNFKLNTLINAHQDRLNYLNDKN